MNDLTAEADHGWGGVPAAPSAAGMIEQKLNELEKQQSAILDGLDALNGRIGSVLRLEVDAPSPELTAARDPEQGGVANRLDDLQEYNRRAIRIIQNLTERVEL